MLHRVCRKTLPVVFQKTVAVPSSAYFKHCVKQDLSKQADTFPDRFASSCFQIGSPCISRCCYIALMQMLTLEGEGWEAAGKGRYSCCYKSIFCIVMEMTHLAASHCRYVHTHASMRKLDISFMTKYLTVTHRHVRATYYVSMTWVQYCGTKQ